MSVIIIGGTFGIGLSWKKYLGKTNNLIILGRSEEKFVQLKNDLANDSTNIICKKVDVTNTDQTQNTLREIITNYSDLDLVVYSSGFYKPNNTFDVDLDLYRKTIEVNFMGLINVMSIILPYKKTTKWTCCNDQFSCRLFGLPNSSGYGPSKAAMMNYSESIYKTVKKYWRYNQSWFCKTRLTDQNKFEMPFLMTAEKAADIIFKGLKKKKYDITFPFMMSPIFKP